MKPLLPTLVAAATVAILTAPAPLRAEIRLDGRVVETKAAGACTNAGELIPGNQRYVDCGNGTVWDLFTGLLWMKRAACASLGSHGNGTASYLQAASAVHHLEHGYDCDGDPVADLTDGSQRGDWRLPTLEEWFDTTRHARNTLGCHTAGMGAAPSLTDETGTLCYSSGGPLFTDVIQTRLYWSSSTPDFGPGSAWGMSLETGLNQDKLKSTLLQLWAVRPATSDPLPMIARVEGAEVETAADPPCVDELGVGIERYVDCADGTVLDTVTGLLWLQDASCTEIPTVNAMGLGNWVGAMEGVPSLRDGLCGLSDGSQPGDWRLPTAAEWQRTLEQAIALGCETGGAKGPPSLTDSTGTDCFVNDPTPIFDGVMTRYWAATLADFDPDEAREVSLELADVNSAAKSSTRSVWPVRQRR